MFPISVPVTGSAMFSISGSRLPVTGSAVSRLFSGTETSSISFLGKTWFCNRCGVLSPPKAASLSTLAAMTHTSRNRIFAGAISIASGLSGSSASFPSRTGTETQKDIKTMLRVLSVLNWFRWVWMALLSTAGKKALKKYSPSMYKGE